jgi:hypothetical protein
MGLSTGSMKASAISRRGAGTRGDWAIILAVGAVAFVPLGGLTFAVRCSAATIVVAQNQPTAPQNVEPVPPSDAASVLGKKVKGPTGEDLGLIVDVLVNPDGRPRAAVIDFGGFLGVGSRKVAIDWKALSFTPLTRAGAVELGLDRAQIAAAPEYKPSGSSAAVVTTPPAPPPVDPDK